ncbi:hypothetical protein PIROE2DRAFT_14138 [Piromyces sp. E2]|nr:hypothetical protein PIROE2DRAFT_14138 [Piromyces sp. E2]|eukprot:OUM60147.1 hypothetical protein PIROE2DRAFT_14138 [Piromyces sp. E2]
MKFLLLNLLLTVIGLVSSAAIDYGERIYITIKKFDSSNDRVQFKLNNVSIKSSDEIKFNMMRNDYDHMPEETSI